jgi:hypothetical protein
LQIHTVKPGEWMQQIAIKYGFPNWEKVWDHPKNSALVSLRKDSELLHPGDKISIPDPQEIELSAASNKKHTFVKMLPKTTLKIKVQDERRQPIANTSWKITLGEQIFEGMSAANGLVEQQIPTAMGEGTLEIATHKFPLRIGHLDPIDEVEGVQKRLHNLGYDCGEINGVVGTKMVQTMKVFQEDNALNASGKVDQASKNKLKELYGC